jgi:predicted ATPase/DNA-binding winged helix-turn-helix (wHTH) protein
MNEEPAAQMLALDSCTVDLGRQLVLRGEDKTRLTTREAELLTYLASNPQRTVSRDELLTEVWGYARPPRTRAVDDTMKRLRPKVEVDPRHPMHLITVHGSGFRFEPRQGSPLTALIGAATHAPPAVPTEAIGPLFGREEALARIHAAFETGARLVSILGPGGVGKSVVARHHRLTYSGAVRTCDLSEARTESDVATALGRAIGLGGGDTPHASLASGLRSLAPTLMVLDSADPVIEPLRALLPGWLSAAPSTRWLITSRARLGCPNERIVELDGLEPAAARALFLAKAQELDPRLRLSEHEQQAIDVLVTRLDGLPLAIELAAARVRVMRPSGLVRRLEDRFRLLSRPGARDRHDGLAATIAWSWTLLNQAERAALAQCTAFTSAFDLDAAEAVIALSADAPWVVDVLAALRDKSMLKSEDSRDGLRFRLPHNIRAWASNQVEGAHKTALADRHAAHFLTWAESIAWAVRQPGAVQRLDQAEALRDNLIAAQRHLSATEQGDLAARMALAMRRCLHGRGHHQVLFDALDAALHHALPPNLRAELLAARALNRMMLHDQEGAEADAASAVALCEEVLGAHSATVWAHWAAGVVAIEGGAYDRGRNQLGHALSAANTMRDAWFRSVLLTEWARSWQLEGNTAEARAAYTAAHASLHHTNDEQLEALVASNLGALHTARGALAEAMPFLQRAAALQRAQGRGSNESITRYNLGLAALALDLPNRAEAAWRRGAMAASDASFRVGEGLSLLGRGVLGTYRGADGRPLLEQAVAVFKDAGAPAWAAYAQTHLAAAHCSMGSADGPCRLQRALELLEITGSPTDCPIARHTNAWHRVWARRTGSNHADTPAIELAPPPAVERTDLHQIALRKHARTKATA